MEWKGEKEKESKNTVPPNGAANGTELGLMLLLPSLPSMMRLVVHCYQQSASLLLPALIKSAALTPEGDSSGALARLATSPICIPRRERREVGKYGEENGE